VGEVPWWGWVILLVVVGVIVAPIKLKILKRMMQKKQQEDVDEQ